MILRVLPENVTPIWGEVEAQLQDAITWAGTHDPEHVRRLILTGAAHLWIQWADRVEASVVTEFVNFPKLLTLRIWLMGKAPDATVVWEEFERALRWWGAEHGATEMREEGRPGWQRRYPRARRDAVTLRTPL